MPVSDRINVPVLPLPHFHVQKWGRGCLAEGAFPLILVRFALLPYEYPPSKVYSFLFVFLSVLNNIPFLLLWVSLLVPLQVVVPTGFVEIKCLTPPLNPAFWIWGRRGGGLNTGESPNLPGLACSLPPPRNQPEHQQPKRQQDIQPDAPQMSRMDGFCG